MEDRKLTKTTVLMRTKNVDWVISQTLEALFSQNYNNFDLLIVDSGSTDNTLKIIKEYPHKFLTIDANDYIPGKVINWAVEQIDSPIITMINVN